MKADLFISVTKKIKEEYNNKINVFTNLIFCIGLISSPMIISILLFLLGSIMIKNVFIAVPIMILMLLSFTVFFFSVLGYSEVDLYSKNLIHKIRLRKKMTKEEKLINIENICFKEKNFQNGLIDYYVSFLEQELSQEDFKKSLEFFLNEPKILDEKFNENLVMIENGLKIINFLIFNKYKDQNIIEVMYDKNKNEILYQLREENPEYKKIFENLMRLKLRQEDFIVDHGTLDHIINYKDFEKILSSVNIVRKMLSNFSIKVLIKLIFETNINKIQDDELQLYKFINNLELERKIAIKKIIIEHALYLKDEKNIYDYKEEFFNLASSLNIKDKDLLYLMSQKITEKEKVEQQNLRIINI